MGVAAVAGEEEREPGETPVASGSRKDEAMDDSRRREGILDWDLFPGGPSWVFCRGGLARYGPDERQSEGSSRIRLAQEEYLMFDVSKTAESWAIPLNKLTRHFLFLRIFRR